MNLFHKRQGQMDVNLCYFYTDTIVDFKHLLADDSLKGIVISSLQYLVQHGLITLYGYVIMPNHIHLLWYIKEQNGKESTAASFTKFTAHQFRKVLWRTETLSLYKCEKDDRRISSGSVIRWRLRLLPKLRFYRSWITYITIR